VAEENNIGASRLLGTNGLQQAVDSLDAKIDKLNMNVEKLAGAMNALTSSNNRATGSTSSYNWNSSSNRANYSANGGGGKFTLGGMLNRNANGGGGSFGALGSGSRLSAGFAALAAIGTAAADYGNKNMASMMQQDYYGVQASQLAGNVTQANINNAARYAMQQSYGALSAQDLYKGQYTGQYTFGPSMNANGSQNAYYRQQMSAVGGFAYANPTLGFSTAATTAQQTFSARSIMMGQAFGLNINPNTQNVGDVAQSLYSYVFGNQKITSQGFGKSITQNGSLATTLRSLGAQMGWSGQTQQEYMGYLQGMVLAQNKGMSQSQYVSLMNQASSNSKAGLAARNQLKSIGVGQSAFEAQRNLNSTRMNRQEDINESMATAFKNTTDVVNKFSQALTDLMKTTGLDKLVGTSAGVAAPISNALSGFSGAFGMGAGLFGAMKLFGGLGSLSGLMKNMGFGSGGAAAASRGLPTGPIGGTPGPGGAYNITSMEPGLTAAGGTEAAMTAANPVGLTLLAAAGAGDTTQRVTWDWMYNHSKNIPFSKIPRPADWTKGNFEDFMSQYQYGLNSPIGWKDQKKRDAWINNFIATHRGSGTTGRSGGGSSSVVGNTPGNGASNMGVSAGTVIGFAKKELGVPYVWGGETPGVGFDCSGLTQWAYGQAGVKIPRVAADQQSASQRVDLNNTLPGDLLFVGNPAHHVVMDIGGGQIIEAPHTGADVRIRAKNPGEFTNAGRFLNNTSTGQSANNQVTPQTLGSMPGAGGDGGAYGGTSELQNLMAALTSTAGTSVVAGSSTGSAASTGATAGAGNIPTGNGQNDKASLQAYAKQLLNARGWGNEWDDFNALVMSESGWDVHATNPSSGAYGIPQALPGSKMASAGKDWQTNGDTQLQWMMGYIADRYGDPTKAWSFHQKNNWYAAGAYNIDKDQQAIVHKGEMIIPAQQAESIRQVLMNNQFNPGLSSRGNGGTISIGNINVNLPEGYSGTPTEAKATGKLIVDAIEEYTRVKNIQVGV
jgi:cell wall-associated NlpC family hydrolase